MIRSVLVLGLVLWTMPVWAATEFLVPGNQAAGELLESIDDDDTAITLDTGQGSAFPSVYPYHVTIGETEIVRVTNRSGDTLTIERAQEGTTAVLHVAGETVELRVTAAYVSRLTDAVLAAEAFIAQVWGGGDGVIREDDDAGLAVTATTPAGLSVDVAAGFAIVGGTMVRYGGGTAGPVTAPSADDRIDLVQLSAAGALTIKAGTEAPTPSAPAADIGCIALATIYCRVGMSMVADSDDSMNGYITDARAFR